LGWTGGAALARLATFARSRAHEAGTGCLVDHAVFDGRFRTLDGLLVAPPATTLARLL